MHSLLFLLRKLRLKRIRRRLFLERLTEPVHLNVLAGFGWLFGSYKAKVDFDLVVRPHYAYGIYRTAAAAARLGVKTVTLIEFGVASGSGLMNMAYIAERVTAETGISFRVYGFDTGQGMPPAKDYRDHPEYYQAGDFQMDEIQLRHALPDSVKLVIREVTDTLPGFMEGLSASEPIGFVAVDVDYYSSTRDALGVFTADPELYLPVTGVYFDDITAEGHNSWSGELLAIREFNDASDFRKLERHRFLPNGRVFRNASWLKQIYFLHVMDHPSRFEVRKSDHSRYLENAYLEPAGKRERFVE